MAIKVNGCTVIDDDRNIVNAGNINVGVITATSFIGNGAGLTNIPSSVITGNLGGNVSVSTFTSAGTWTKPSTAKMVYVESFGGGSGGTAGAGAPGPFSIPSCDGGGNVCGGSGGIGGKYITNLYSAADLPPTVPVVVGSGGAINGGTGGNSCFFSLSSANGTQIANSGGNGGSIPGIQMSPYYCNVPRSPSFGGPYSRWGASVSGTNGCGCGAASGANPGCAAYPFTWTQAPASNLSSRNGTPGGTGFGGGSGGSVCSTLSVSPTALILYSSPNARSVSRGTVYNGNGGNGGCMAGGGGGSAGSGCGGSGGTGRVVVYTWE